MVARRWESVGGGLRETLDAAAVKLALLAVGVLVPLRKEDTELADDRGFDGDATDADVGCDVDLEAGAVVEARVHRPLGARPGGAAVVLAEPREPYDELVVRDLGAFDFAAENVVFATVLDLHLPADEGG